MNYKNAEILLSVVLAGRLATRGKYQSSVKTDSNGRKIIAIERKEDGSIEKTEAIDFKTIKLPCFHEASIGIKLNSDFVRHAVSADSRPKTISAGVWGKMTDLTKINLHVKLYVNDLYPNHEYTYQILEGDEEEN